MRDFNAEACAVNERFADGEITEAEKDALFVDLDAEKIHQDIWTSHRLGSPDGYPSVIEQLDLLWHAIDDGALDKTSDFYVQIKAVKTKWPKDNSGPVE